MQIIISVNLFKNTGSTQLLECPLAPWPLLFLFTTHPSQIGSHAVCLTLE